MCSFLFLFFLRHIPNTHWLAHTSKQHKVKTCQLATSQATSWLWLSEQLEDKSDFEENLPPCGTKPSILSFVISSWVVFFSLSLQGPTMLLLLYLR